MLDADYLNGLWIKVNDPNRSDDALGTDDFKNVLMELAEFRQVNVDREQVRLDSVIVERALTATYGMLQAKDRMENKINGEEDKVSPLTAEVNAALNAVARIYAEANRGSTVKTTPPAQVTQGQQQG